MGCSARFSNYLQLLLNYCFQLYISGLNDRDLIGVGGRYTIAEAKGEKYIFLYRVYAPTNWGEEDDIDTDTEAGMYR